MRFHHGGPCVVGSNVGLAEPSFTRAACALGFFLITPVRDSVDPPIVPEIESISADGVNLAMVTP